MHTDRINVSYIMNLIANLTMDDEKRVIKKLN